MKFGIKYCVAADGQNSHLCPVTKQMP